MTAEVKIDTGVPVPQPKHVINRGRFKPVYLKMEIGDSVAFPTRVEASSFHTSAISYWGRRSFTTRKVGPNEFRVWRVR